MTPAGITPGYDAILNSAGVIDLSARARIRVTGEDRARLLHAMTTNHVQQLKPGEGLYAFFLNAQGRILADAYVLCFDDHLLLDTEPETRVSVYEHLDRYIIADDVTLEDVSEQTFCLGLEGPSASAILSGIALPPPGSAFAHAGWGEFVISSASSTGAPGFRIFGPVARREELLQKLEGAGAIAASDGEAELARLRHFKPRFGTDFSDATLPQETQLMHALHFQKGCYLGQEIVERIRSRGHVNKHLMGFRAMSAAAAFAKGDQLLASDKAAGEVTSSGLVPEGGVYGLAMVRVPHNKPGGLLRIGEVEAELLSPDAPGLPRELS